MAARWHSGGGQGVARGNERSVATDVRAMRTLFVTGRLLGRDRQEVDQIFTEIQERLKEELDYYKEAANLELFHRELAHIDGLRIPRTYGEYCTDRFSRWIASLERP